MKRVIDSLVYSFFVLWSILLALITYFVWRDGEVLIREPTRWIVNLEMVFGLAIIVFSVFAWGYLIYWHRRNS